MNEIIADKFIKLYYGHLNNHAIAQLIPHLRECSTYVRDNVTIKGRDNIQNMLNQFGQVHFEPKQMTILVNGDRRANIMVSGIMVSGISNTKYTFCEFMHLAYGNDKNYWIHSSILQTV